MESMIEIGGKREGEREREKGSERRRKEGEDWHTQGKTITYPSCTPGAHFHPSKRGKESHRLRYANYFVQSMHIHIFRYTCAHTHARLRTYLRVIRRYVRVCFLYTLGHSSSSRRALPRPHETEVGFSLYGYSTTKIR